MNRKLTTTSSRTTSAPLQAAAGHCSACGSQNVPEELRCRFCGDWLFDLGRCGLCDEIVATRDKRCVACGISFDRLSPKPYTPPPARQKRPRLWLVPVVTLLVVLALVPDALAAHDVSTILVALMAGAVMTGVAALGAMTSPEDDVQMLMTPSSGEM